MNDLSKEELNFIKKYVLKKNVQTIVGAFFFFIIIAGFNLIFIGYLYFERYPSTGIIITLSIIDILLIMAAFFLIKTGNLKIKYLDRITIDNLKGKFITKTEHIGDSITTEHFIDNLRVLVPRKILRKIRHEENINAKVVHLSLRSKKDKSGNIFVIQDSLVIGLNN